MKKITLLLITTFLMMVNIYGQQVFNMHPIESPNAFKASMGHNSQAKTMQTGFIDYSWENYNDLSYVWQFNSLYTSLDTSFNYIGVACVPFNVIYDYADNDVDFTLGTYPTSWVFTVDSIYALITHENNSGTYNKLKMQIVQLSPTSTLTDAATVLWSQNDSTNTSLSPSGNWLGTDLRYMLTYAPNFTTTPGQKIGVVIRYEAPDSDTLGVIGSSVEDLNNPGNTMTQSPYPTSFMRYPPFIPNITTNRTVGYGTPVGSNGWIEVQDWEIWIKVTFNDSVPIGVRENNSNGNLVLHQNTPNPAKNNTVIRYNLTEDLKINFKVSDYTGRIIFETEESNATAGEHKLNLDLTKFASGIYFYTLSTDKGTLTRKMVVK